MSMDSPNEYEQAIEAYADAVRRENDTRDAAALAAIGAEEAQQARQAAWRIVRAFVADKKIQPGIYRLNRGPGMYADGLLIQEHHDYPKLFPMFR